MKLLWLQSKLQWTASIDNWIKHYHHIRLRNLKKSSDKLKMKNPEQYDYIHDTGLRALGGVSILIRKNVPQSKININLQRFATSAILHKTISICSLWIPPHDPKNEKEQTNLIKQLPKQVILIGDFNSHNIIRGSKTTNKRSQSLEKNHL